MLLELKNGKRRKFPDAIAEVLLKKGIGKKVEDAPVYETRMLQAEPVSVAPYGFKADGTPRKRPGRRAN